ncbi:hypothetical protein ACWGLF_43875 [Streptomyces puniciscabiei]
MPGRTTQGRDTDFQSLLQVACTAELFFLTAVRGSYDTVTADYVEHVPSPTAMDPLSRAMPAGFAELVRTAGPGLVADLVCGLAA